MAHTFKGAMLHHFFFLRVFFYRRGRAPKLDGFNQLELIAKDENLHGDKCDNDNEDDQINFLCSGL